MLLNNYCSCSKHNYTGINNPCPYCVDEKIKRKFEMFAKNQTDIPKEYIDLINKNFWNLI